MGREGGGGVGGWWGGGGGCAEPGMCLWEGGGLIVLSLRGRRPALQGGAQWPPHFCNAGFAVSTCCCPLRCAADTLAGADMTIMEGEPAGA